MHKIIICKAYLFVNNIVLIKKFLFYKILNWRSDYHESTISGSPREWKSLSFCYRWVFVRKGNPSRDPRYSGTYRLLLLKIDSSQALICTNTHTTVSGRRCQHWDRDYPHRPNNNMRNRLGFTGHNFCAVADPNDSRPFCYTTDPYKRWDYCDCQPCNRTESGSQCLPWDSHYAHVHYR